MIKIGKITRSKEIFVLTFFKNLNVKDLSDNRKLWKTIKPSFSNQGLNSNKPLLKEKGT